MGEAGFLPMYLAALAAVNLTPGPDMALVMSTAAGVGPRAGIMSATGIAAARVLQVLAAGLGLAALLAAQPALLVGVRWVGASYMAWLAWKTWQAASGGQVQGGTFAPGSSMLRGFLASLPNPNAVLFCAVLLPQFVSPGRGPLWQQFVLLGAILVAMGWMFDAAYALAASGIARRFRIPARFDRARNLAMVAVFLTLAVWLVAGSMQ